jgi:hypothetical protein
LPPDVGQGDFCDSLLPPDVGHGDFCEKAVLAPPTRTMLTYSICDRDCVAVFDQTKLISSNLE